jgi:phage terminase large subunit-like protein
MIEKIPELKKRNLIFINDMNNKNKDNRIATIQDPVNNGQIIFADNNKAFTDQILDFQGTAYTLHDDAADVVSDFANKILKIKTKNIIRFMDRRRLGV